MQRRAAIDIDPPASPETTHWRWSDLRAAAALGIDASRGITALVEGVHQAVWNRLGVADKDGPARTGGLTGAIYRSIDGTMFGVGYGLDALLKRLTSHRGQGQDSLRRLAWLGALNGVIGDHLHATANPLALPMALSVEAGSGGGRKLAVFIHGLCMSDQHWRASEPDQADYGRALQALGYTPVYVRYNSGRPVSANGLELAQRLQQWLQAQPEPINEICLIGHSMGGLLARSAAHYAEQMHLDWPKSLNRMIFLGTPHHGAPLEQAGNQIDRLLAISRFSAPFTRLGGIRSSGIRDLRYGYLIDEHGADQGNAHLPRPVALPAAARTLAIAAVLGTDRSLLADHLSGDGLVPVCSALGLHAKAQHTLRFEQTHVAAETGHLQLLHSQPVQDQILHWLQH